MREYVTRRVLLIIPGVFILTVIVFTMVRLIPGDAVIIIALQMSGGRSSNLTPELEERLRARLGLDKPIHMQYVTWISEVARGDLGRSMLTHTPVIDEIKKRFPVTLELVLMTLVLLVAWGLTIGTVSAIYQDTLADYVMRSIAILGLSVPFFWSAVLLLLFGSLWLNWSPPWGVISLTEEPLQNLQQFFVPAMLLAISQGSAVARMTRAAILEVLNQDYVRTARAKGLHERVVIARHTMKNAMIPVVGLIGVQFAFALGGSVILEQIWGLPGMGNLMLTAVKQRDYPTIQGVILFIGSLVMLVNVLVDLSYGWLNPRIRFN
jgi:peptide/nickel transport system permease protein